jgi:hypothetical protein
MDTNLGLEHDVLLLHGGVQQLALDAAALAVEPECDL